MELIDIEITLRLREHPSPVTFEQMRAMFGPHMQDLVTEAINRLATPRLHLVEIIDGEIWLTLAGRLCARYLGGVAYQHELVDQSYVSA